MTYGKFIEFYDKHGYCPNDISREKNSMNEVQLKSRYEKYIKSCNKKQEAQKRYIEKANNKELIFDVEWEYLVKEVFKRDEGKCRLIKILSIPDYGILKQKAVGLLNIIDPAHIFRRTECLKLKYDIDNVICLNRFSHSMIDFYRSPLTGIPITKEEQKEWWIRIVGYEFYKNLENKSRSRI